MISERQVYIYIQLPGALESIPAAVLRVQTLPDGMRIGRFRYGDRYLQHAQAIALDPYQLQKTRKANNCAGFLLSLGATGT